MYLHKLSLQNIKSFPVLELDFRHADQALCGLNVVVGGNASGKTTLLKAIALALCGPTIGRSLVKSTVGWITRDQDTARIDLQLEWDKEIDKFRMRGKMPGRYFDVGVKWEVLGSPRIPEFKEAERRTTSGTRILSAKRGPWDDNATGWFSAGYGAMRRLTGSSAEGMREAAGGGKVSRYVSLFREDVALSESEVWLKELQFKALENDPGSIELVQQIQSFLNDGLLPRGFRITRITSDHVFVSAPGGDELPMRDISDGLRSIYALMLDIVRHLTEVYEKGPLFTPDSTGRLVVAHPGIILIDELEAHLHPSWQKTICTWLKTRFPRIQFLVTSHSPLVAQAADIGGLFVLPMPGEERLPHKLPEHEQKRIALGRAEKVLLGEAFGLLDTRSEWANQLIERYKRLEAKRRAGRLEESTEKAELSDLKQQMLLVFEDAGVGDASQISEDRS